ncbi:hypothetical protein Plhal304r1_c004g0016331 [Plasmopara halstedii]
MDKVERLTTRLQRIVSLTQGELHAHIHGSIRPKTLEDLLKRRQTATEQNLCVFRRNASE